MLGSRFEAELREQPAVWRRIAASDAAATLARALDDDIVLTGSGSSLYMAELGALALRRRRVRAQALPSTEARLDHAAYENKTVIAISQSGESHDLFAALDVLRPRQLVALTNSTGSRLAARADLTIDVQAGTEHAVPASKSVTATAAILLWTAALIGGQTHRDRAILASTADDVERWLGSGEVARVAAAAKAIAQRRHAAVLGSDYGLPIAREIALKLKEASYMHAEGFAAGEFRHGSAAMLDDSFAIIGVVDPDGFDIVARPLREISRSGALRYVVGSCDVDDLERLGPQVGEAYNTLAWLVTGQMVALHAARERGIDADSPRGLTKALIAE